MEPAAEKIAVLRRSLEGAENHARAALGHREADACLLGGLLKGALHEIFPASGGDEAAATGFAAALSARAGGGRHVLWLRTDFAALEHGEVSAPGLVELGLDPARFLLLRAPDALSILRAGLDALSCPALGALVLEIPGTPKILDLSASRRFVLAAQQSGVTAFLLRLDAEAEPSAAETRWLVRTAHSEAEPAPGPCVLRQAQDEEVLTCIDIDGRKTFPHAEPVEARMMRRPRRTLSPSPTPYATALPARGGGKEGDWGYPRFDAELVRHRHGRLGQWVMEWNCDDGVFRAADSGAVVSAPADRPAAAQSERRRIA